MKAEKTIEWLKQTNYKLQRYSSSELSLDQTNNSWKIFDVLIDGSISEIATKKSEFKNFINQVILHLYLRHYEKNSTLLNN